MNSSTVLMGAGFRSVFLLLALGVRGWGVGEDSTELPVAGKHYRKGDMERPRPAVVESGLGAVAGGAPSDAVVLFDGKDLSAWETAGKDEDRSAKWKVTEGYFEVVPKTGAIRTKAKFGSCQIHLEWATPSEVVGNGQGRGNSGFFIDGHPEIQILDSYENDTYPDGQASALYSYLPPLVNASRKPGEWQVYDIVYVAPRVVGGKVESPATYTVFHNGVLTHHAVEVPGSAVECSFTLQDHGNPMRFRNMWVRPLRGYDGAASAR